MKFQFGIFAKKFDEIFVSSFGQGVRGYVILTHGPENFPEVRVKMTYPLSHI